MQVVTVKNGKYNDPYNMGRLTINKKMADGIYLPMMGYLFLVKDTDSFAKLNIEFEEFINNPNNERFIDDLIWKCKGFDYAKFSEAISEKIETANKYTDFCRQYYAAFNVAEELTVISDKVVGFTNVSFSDTVRSSEIFYSDTYNVIQLELSNGITVLIKGDVITDTKFGTKYSQHYKYATPTKDWRIGDTIPKYKFTFNNKSFHI